MTFPTVSGSNLLREKLTLPQDFQGRLNLVFIPFERWHQTGSGFLEALAEELEEKYEGLVYYELPTSRRRILSTRFFSTKACVPASPTQKRVSARSHFIWIRQISVPPWT